MRIRQFGAADANAFAQLRLSALQLSASAFGSSHEEEKDRTLAQVQSHLVGSAERVFFGAWLAHESLVGIVGVGREPALKERHIASVRSLYVAPSARGQGVGRQLLAAALRQAEAWVGVEQVTLSVTVGQTAAVQLYRSAGFTEVGRMPRALKVGNEYHDELVMLRLVGAA